MRLLFIILVLFSSLITIAQNIHEGQSFDWKIGDSWMINMENYYIPDGLTNAGNAEFGKTKIGEYEVEVSVIDTNTLDDKLNYTLLFYPDDSASRTNLIFISDDRFQLENRFTVKNIYYTFNIDSKNANIIEVWSKCTTEYLPNGKKTLAQDPLVCKMDSLNLSVVYPNVIGQVYGGFPLYFIPSFGDIESAYFSRYGENVEDVLDAFLIYEKQVLENETIISLTFNLKSSKEEYAIIQKWDKGASWWKEYLVYYNGYLNTRATVIEP